MDECILTSVAEWAFDDEFKILVLDEDLKAEEEQRLKEVEAEVDEQNEKFAKGEASSGAKLYPFSDLSKEEFEKEKEGLIIPENLWW